MRTAARWPYPVVSHVSGAGLSAQPPTPGCRPYPWTERMAHACENTTLPQTSFAGGKNDGY